jgi:SAM-dependent methyltransferase
MADAGSSWPGRRVLELGCGTGTFTDACLRAGAADYVGVDLSGKMIERAASKFAGNRAAFFNESLEDFARRGTETFDLAFSFSFLHHLPSLDEGLAQISGLLRPDGIYVALHEIDSTHRWTLLEKMDFRLQILCGYNEYSRSSLRHRIAAALRGHRRDTTPGDVDLVDYQLKGGFSLSSRCSAWGKIVPYCYLGFPELMILGRPLNHQMLILKKAPGHRHTPL